jgi:hypothetical protein
MSRWLNRADALATYLAAEVEWCKAPTPEEERVPVLVDRKLQINSIVAQTTAKAKGASVVILWTGGKNPDRKSKLLKMGGRYSIFVMTKPLFKDGLVTCDELTEVIAEAAHGWTPSPTPNAVTQRLEVLDVELMPHKTLLIYEITAEIQRLGT